MPLASDKAVPAAAPAVVRQLMGTVPVMVSGGTRRTSTLGTPTEIWIGVVACWPARPLMVWPTAGVSSGGCTSNWPC